MKLQDLRNNEKLVNTIRVLFIVLSIIMFAFIHDNYLATINVLAGAMINLADFLFFGMAVITKTVIMLMTFAPLIIFRNTTDRLLIKILQLVGCGFTGWLVVNFKAFTETFTLIGEPLSFKTLLVGFNCIILGIAYVGFKFFMMRVGRKIDNMLNSYQPSKNRNDKNAEFYGYTRASILPIFCFIFLIFNVLPNIDNHHGVGLFFLSVLLSGAYIALMGDYSNYNVTDKREVI